ncbi:Las1-like-domain-containing protein [Aphelenchoides besseyi]|nr:Las1-like-domain-containing protein [Aphelenchoides besseyi]
MRKERLPPSFPPHPKWKIRRYGTQRPFNDTKPDDVFDFDNQSASPIVPYTIAEFCYIQDHFAHDDLETLQTIYDILLMWESRMDGPTLLIDITKMIVQGLLFDKKHVDRATGDEEIDSQQDLSLLFGIVITRFVNYVESIQRRSRFNAPGANPMENFCAQKSTMLNAAMELGLPGDVVEVRHAIVHRAMPKLDVLRATIQTCRQWLWDVHWNMPIEIALNVIETKEPSSVEKPQIQKIKPREFMAAFWDYAAMKQRKRELSELEYAELRRKICKIRLLMSDDPIKAAIALSSAFLLNNDRLIELGEQQPKVEEKHDVWKIPYKWRLFLG